MRICVSGASGTAGRATVADLLAHGHDVRATDLAPAPADLGVPLLQADLTDYGQTIEVRMRRCRRPPVMLDTLWGPRIIRMSSMNG